jgi:hypothetical protein
MGEISLLLFQVMPHALGTLFSPQYFSCYIRPNVRVGKHVTNKKTHIRTNRVATTVRGRAGDDITQPQDDDRNVRNCSNLHIFIFLEEFSGANPLEG